MLQLVLQSVPYELAPQQAQRRVDICRQLTGNPMDDRFMRKIVICDEKEYIIATVTPLNSGSVPLTFLSHR